MLRTGNVAQSYEVIARPVSTIISKLDQEHRNGSVTLARCHEARDMKIIPPGDKLMVQTLIYRGVTFQSNSHPAEPVIPAAPYSLQYRGIRYTIDPSAAKRSQPTNYELCYRGVKYGVNQGNRSITNSLQPVPAI